MKYGERLKMARERAGLSQEELAALTKGVVKQGSISKIERGDQQRSSFDIPLAMVLGIHPKWLKDEDPKYKPEWFLTSLQPGLDYSNLKTSINHVNENTCISDYNKEVRLITAFKRLATFQQDELIKIAEDMADYAEKFRHDLGKKHD